MVRTGIVCEGGGMRGVYTAGVLQAFLEGGFLADELVGVSAGASNGANYVSGQHGRGMRTNIDYAGDKRYLSLSNLLKTRSLFGMDFIFGDIPNSLDPFDFTAMAASPCEYFVGATSLTTGKAVFFGKEHMTPGLTVLRASCSIPLLAPVIDIDGRPYLDGGVADPIPIDKAIADGCTRLVVILTRPRDYQKKPTSLAPLYQRLYREYPLFQRTLQVRHLVYNHTLERLRRLEDAGRAVVIAPAVPLPAGRLAQNPHKMQQSYDQGLSDGAAALTLL